MSSHRIALLWATFYLASPMLAQDSCNALLQHGIYDKLVETGTASSRSQAEEGICRAYHQYESDATHADASGNYYEVIKGSGSYSGSQVKSLGEEMCEHHSSESSNDQYAHIDRRTVSPAAVQAWEECTRNAHLSTTTSWRDTDQGTIGMAVSFHLASGGNDATVKAVSTDNMKCTSPELGPLINSSSKPVALGLTSYTLDCKRDVKDAAFQSGTRKVFAESARLTVDTSAGAITRDLPAILPPAPPDPLPFGTVVAWYSTSGPIPAGWHLCDGTGGTPNLMDKFIRGTGKFDEVGKPGGSNQTTLPSIDLSIGQPDRERGLRESGGNGVINHHSMGEGLVDSFTVPTAVTIAAPPYVSLVYIIKQ